MSITTGCVITGWLEPAIRGLSTSQPSIFRRVSVSARVIVICPDPLRRRLLTTRAQRRFPAATVESSAGLIDGMPRIWATRPELIVVAGLSVDGRDGWRLPELRHAAGDAQIIVVGDRDGRLGQAVRADIARADWQIKGRRRASRSVVQSV